MNETMDGGGLPASLGEAIGTEPLWLQAWVLTMVLVHLASLLFVAGREQQQWRFRLEPLAIFVSFVVAAVIMSWIYDRFGYVRLLGLAHLVAWTPVYVWILRSRQRFPVGTMYGKYIYLYLLIAGVSLVIDAVDVVRWLAGDGDLFLRWS